MKTIFFRTIKASVLFFISCYTIIFLNINIVTTTVMLIIFSIFNSIILNKNKRIRFHIELFLLQLNTVFFLNRIDTLLWRSFWDLDIGKILINYKIVQSLFLILIVINITYTTYHIKNKIFILYSSMIMVYIGIIRDIFEFKEKNDNLMMFVNIASSIYMLDIVLIAWLNILFYTKTKKNIYKIILILLIFCIFIRLKIYKESFI